MGFSHSPKASACRRALSLKSAIEVLLVENLSNIPPPPKLAAAAADDKHDNANDG